jgi:integrase/recombinase XerD
VDLPGRLLMMFSCSRLFVNRLHAGQSHAAGERSAGDSGSPRLISGFLLAHARHVCGRQLVRCGSGLRVFLRYPHREGILAKDLGRAVPRGSAYQNAAVPRDIPWSDVERAVANVDRRSTVGKRDYAILLLINGTYTANSER